jgi:hypothetical protein
MAIKSKQLLDYAQKRRDSESEVEIRSAISRSYYSAFHDLRGVAARVPAVGSSATGSYISAEEILGRLRSWNVAAWPSLQHQRPVAARVERTFRALRDERVCADYFLDLDCTNSCLDECVGRAGEVARAAAQLMIAVRSAQEK